MSLPVQAPPVRRPAIVEPHRLIEVDKGSGAQLLRARLLLLHGANVNDPAPYAPAMPDRMKASAALPASAWGECAGGSWMGPLG